MSTVDLPPNIGLQGTPLGLFRAPRVSRILAAIALVFVVVLGVITWWMVVHHPYRRGDNSTKLVLPLAFAAFTLLGFLVRSARVAITRDGVRWGWTSIAFQQSAARITCAHIYRDGVALEARRGSWWFLAARDWDRFDALVRQLRRTELPLRDHEGRAPFRARLQSYGRFLDGLLLSSVLGAIAVAVWAS